ncbi:Fic family protein [bacterium]|nr:Fic family protein [bacterium]
MFKPRYSISNKLLAIIERITELKIMIENSTKQLKWLPRLSKEALVKTIHSSTAIEGNPLSEREVNLLVNGDNAGYIKERDRKEIVNYLEALRYIEKNSSIKYIEEKQVLQLHSLIGKNNALDRGPIGKYRDYLVRVGKYIAPDAKLVSGKMKSLIDWLKSEAISLNPVISSAILHYKFESIHPFGDGNGRVGRLLALWDLYRRSFDKHHIFAVDEYYWENQEEYYKELQDVQNKNNDLTKWIEFVAGGIEQTLEKTLIRIKSTEKESDQGERIVLTQKQEKILNLLRSGDMSTSEIRESVNLSRQGVWFLMKPLMDKKVVKKVGDSKRGKYRLL